MPRAGSFPYVAICLAIAGCGTDGAPYSIGDVSPLPPGPISFHCPSGVRQWTSSGNVLTWSGADPVEPGGCLGTDARGRGVKTAMGVIFPYGYAPGSMPTLTAALTQLASRPPGSVVSYTLRTNTVWNAQTELIQRDFRLKIRGTQDLHTPAGSFHTMVIEENLTNAAAIVGVRNVAYTFIRWIDLDTGLLLRQRLINWDSSSIDWTTTRVEKLSQAARPPTEPPHDLAPRPA